MTQYLRPYIEALLTTMASFSTGQVTVDVTADLIVAANASRKFLEITNTSFAREVYIGNSNVTTTTGHYLAAGASFVIDLSICTAAFYGITSAGSVTLTYVEW